MTLKYLLQDLQRALILQLEVSCKTKYHHTVSILKHRDRQENHYKKKKKSHSYPNNIVSNLVSPASSLS